MTQFPRSAELPWFGLTVLVAATVGVYLLGGFVDWLARPSARSPAPPPVAAIATPRPPAAALIPPSPPPLRAPPHSTREELSALLRFLKGGGDLTDSQRRELWDKGIRFRREPGKQHTLEIVVPPGYFPAERPPHQNTESAHDRWRRLNNVR